MGDHVVLPEIEFPWQPRSNAHLTSARTHARNWAAAMGLLDDPALWSAETFQQDDLALFAALTHPDASESRLLEIVLWRVLTTALDDYVAARFKRTADLRGAEAFVQRLAEFLPLDGGSAPQPANPIERGLAELWPRTRAALPRARRARFAAAVYDFAECMLWELANDLRGCPPDPADYLDMVRRTAGTDLTVALLGIDVPAEAEALLGSFADVAALLGDLHSYQREVEQERGHSNAVPVIREFFGCPLQAAVNMTHRLTRAHLDEFQQATRQQPLAPALRGWLAGAGLWYRSTGRYQREWPVIPRPSSEITPAASVPATAP
ncbi:hypothetical protein D5S17_10395 [Pseudonocardiaceae bacterium YIM PH 21723]|nr:hypothetical protein D5S17_10395 [Pseudonocardiaceae bacterium YIM PH 21723]